MTYSTQHSFTPFWRRMGARCRRRCRRNMRQMRRVRWDRLGVESQCPTHSPNGNVRQPHTATSKQPEPTALLLDIILKVKICT